MKNILGTQFELRLYDRDGNLVYEFFWIWGLRPIEKTYDKSGNTLTYKDGDGYSWEKTYNENGNSLTFKDSDDYSWEYTYDSSGNELTFKNSNGVKRGFDIPEFTMEQLVEKMGNFKLIKKQ